jgi:murein DD-endopeptidase MepM/ murein hydrolase activator NlpD
MRISVLPALSLVTSLSLSAGSAWPFRPAAVPGGVAVVDLPQDSEPTAVLFRGERVLVRKQAGRWKAIVGIPLKAQEGADSIDADGRKISFVIHPKRYAEQRITLKNKHQVNPDKEDEARIAKEQELMAPQWKMWPEKLIPSLEFKQPAKGRLTASFGMRRIFNGEPRNPHPGLDIAAPRGSAVSAPAGGVVLLTGDFFFSGNTVMIGHGEGVVSLLCHLQDFKVHQGQVLRTGDLVGHVGTTGRSTGPHLHWTLSLNNARVDPGLFLPR